jgi:hypothetical protein
MATVSAQDITLDGLEAEYSQASAGGDLFAPGATTLLHVRNGSGASINATVATTFQVFGLDLENVVTAIPAGEERFLGPYQRTYFAASSGFATVSWSATGSVTFAVLRM